MKLGIIGLGQMGLALVRGIIDGGVFVPREIIASDLVLAKKENRLVGKVPEGITTVFANRETVKKAETILLAVKPQVLDSVLAEIADSVGNKLVISIAAGVTIGHLQQKLPEARIARVMPNTPALIKEGIAAVTMSEKTTTRDKKLVTDIFQGVGRVIMVKEDLMDAVTGISGSGPAYVYLILEALADGGVLKGLARDDALELAAQTVVGAARMVLETKKHPAQLKDMVTSPGGTTIAGLEVLEKRGLRGILMEAVSKAGERSRQLGAD